MRHIPVPHPCGAPFGRANRLSCRFVLRVRCEQCHAEKLVAFSCKKLGFRPSCGVRRMAQTAALPADEVLPERPPRQWVLSLPHALRSLLATNPAALTQVLGVVYRTIARHLIGQAGLTRSRAATAAVTLIQRFGSARNLNIHFHMLLLDGVCLFKGAHPTVLRPAAGPSANELQRLVERIGAHVGQVLEPWPDRAREARAAVPLHQSPGRGHRAPGTERLRAGPRCAQDCVPRRHDAPRARAAGADGAPGSAGAAAAAESARAAARGAAVTPAQARLL